MVDGRNFFDKPIRNDLKTCNNITWWRWWLHIWIFTRLSLFQKKCYKQQQLAVHPKAIQLIIFTENLTKVEGATMFSIIEETKETLSDFSKVAV